MSYSYYEYQLLKERERLHKFLNCINIAEKAVQEIRYNDLEDRYDRVLKILMFGLQDIKEQVKYDMSENDISIENWEYFDDNR